MAVRIVVPVKSNGKPDMRYAANRERFLKEHGANLDGSADVRLSYNKDKISTKKDVERHIKPNLREDYFAVSEN